MSEHEVGEESLRNGRVVRVGQWAVGLTQVASPSTKKKKKAKSEPFAVSRRCRHQLADLSEGHVDAEGCLVCPWHASRYDVRTGRMVTGPRGFLWYRGPTPGYSALVHALGRVLPLRVGRTRLRAGRVVVDD